MVFVCLSISGYGAKPEQIPLQQNKVCQIIFPDKIAKIRGGYNPNHFALDKYDNILYIQCLTDFPNTNLSIITDDTSCYMLDLCYTEKSEKNAYIIDIADRIYVNELKPLGPGQEPSPSLRSQPAEDKTPTQAAVLPETGEYESILKQRDFIVAQNGVADKAMEGFLKGIYTRANYVYFKLDITNNSELPYTYNYCGFAIVTKKKGRMTSFDRTDLSPAGSYVPAHTIEYKKTMTVIYKFDKFNFSNDRVLLIEMVEDNGERGLFFRVTSSTFLKARKI
ncbi:MAG: DUF4138 domain-containing protein [Alistipes sp.]|nr:DUF4138 domain-containing protein [Alistipes sp.]